MAPARSEDEDEGRGRRGCSLAAAAVLCLVVWVAVVGISFLGGFRDLVEERMQKRTGMAFLIGKAHLDLRWDLVLRDVEWSDDESELASARADRVVLRWRMLRSLLEKRFVVDEVAITGMEGKLEVPQQTYFSMPQPKDVAKFLLDLGRPHGFFQSPDRRFLSIRDSHWIWIEPPTTAGQPDQVYYEWSAVNINVAPVRIPGGVMRDHVAVGAAMHPPGAESRIPLGREFLVRPEVEGQPPSLIMVGEE